MQIKDGLLRRWKLIRDFPFRILGPWSGTDYRNIEGLSEYDFRRHRTSSRRGVSCLIRAKNEAANIIECLQSIDGAFAEIVFVDNGSDDDTLSLVQKFAGERDDIQVLSYPHKVARCGDEHNATDEYSVHSLAYYYNWCVSHCRYAYFCKWDADMMLAPEDKNAFRALSQAPSPWWPTMISLYIQTLYKVDDRYYLAKNEVNWEPRVIPNRSDFRFIKAKDFEMIEGISCYRDRTSMKDVKIYELKDVSVDEFSHWTSTDNFTTPRKKIEWENFQRLRSGEIDPAIIESVPGRPY